MYSSMRSAFTIVELMIVITIIAILASISIVAYNGWQQNTAKSVAKSDLQQVAALLKSHNNFNSGYPTSIYSDQLSDAGKPHFKPSSNDMVVINYHTNATSHPVYMGMTNAQKLVLFVDICKQVITESSPAAITQSYHNSCEVANLLGLIGLGGILGIRTYGSKSGSIETVTNGLGRRINDTFTIKCGWGAGLLGLQSCDPYDSDITNYKNKMTAVSTEIKARYTAQGGTFPIDIPSIDLGFANPPALPQPTMVSDDNATKYCAEAVSTRYGNFIYNISSSNPSVLKDGACPANSSSW